MSNQQSAKILILTASFGSGHLTASEAIKNTLITLGHRDVEVVDFFNMTMPRLNKLVRSFYMETLKRAPKLYGTFYDEINRIEQDSWLQKKFNQLGYGKLLQYLRGAKPAIVICAYPTPAGVIAHMRKKGDYDCSLVTAITDFEAHSQWINPDVDLYLVAHEGITTQLTRAGIAASRIVVTGIPISHKFSLNQAADKETSGLNPELPVVLIMSGGSGMENIAYEALDACNNLTQEVQVVMICGNDVKLKKDLDEKFAANPRLKILGFVNNIDELMSVADVLITKPGGVTISEALANGLPMILYRPIPGQEEANARFIADSGAGFLANNQDELTAYLIKALDATESIRLKNAARLVAKPNAAKDAAREIIGLMAEGSLGR